jgi:hypothetical protein
LFTITTQQDRENKNDEKLTQGKGRMSEIKEKSRWNGRRSGLANEQKQVGRLR